MSIVPFQVLVIDARCVHPDRILELDSEFTFLDKLYYLDVAYEFEWVRNKPHQAEILIDGD